MQKTRLTVASLIAAARIAAAGSAAMVSNLRDIVPPGPSGKSRGRANRSRPGAQMASIRKARKERNVKRFRAQCR